MNVANIKFCDIANGLGVRTSLFVSGCRNACKECFNQEAWDFSYGAPFDEEKQKEILDSLSPGYIAGLSVLGGEPFEPENQEELALFLARVKKEFPEKPIWCYTGFQLEELLGKERKDGKNCRAVTPFTRRLLEQIDILVDGRFEKELYDITLKFRGSSNQRVIDLKKTLACSHGEIYLFLE